jgi:hypothetical protein
MLFNAASLPSSEWNVLMATSTWKQNLTFKYNNYHQKYMIEFNVPDVSFTKCNTWYSAELLDKIYTWIPFELLFFVNTLTSNDIPYGVMPEFIFSSDQSKHEWCFFKVDFPTKNQIYRKSELLYILKGRPLWNHMINIVETESYLSC